MKDPRKMVDSLSDGEVKQALMDFRLTSTGANLTKKLKEEWQAAERYATRRRKENWDNRKIGKAQGTSLGGTRQERMRLPTLAELEIEKHFGLDWHNNKKAHDWAWKQFPQFRLVDKK